MPADLWYGLLKSLRLKVETTRPLAVPVYDKLSVCNVMN